MTQLKIEKGIPVPENKGGKPGVYTVAFQKMNEGDSFLISTDKAKYAYHAARRLGIRAILRKVGENQTRVWHSGSIPKVLKKAA